MSNRENRRAERSTNRRPVSKTQIKRGNLIAALVFLIPVLLCAGLVWHAQASNLSTPANASAPASGDTQSDPASSGDVPTVAQPTQTAPDNQAVTPAKPKKETYLELDMSRGKGLFTAWRIEPSDKAVVIERGDHKKVGLIGEVRQGDVINMNQGLTALVTKAEKYTDPHPDADSKPDADGNVAERVIGWSKHITDTLLDLRTTDEDVITTPEHPFFVHSKGWVKAGALHPGDQIETESADKLVTVVSTEVEHKRQAVYNLDVEKTHTFYVGKDKLLVHNGDCVPEIPEKAWWGTGKAPTQVTPGTRSLEGQYINDFNGRVEPWQAHYDEYGRMIGRTDYNAGNIAHGIPDTHYHSYGYNNGIPYPIANHAPGVFVP
jgi:YD repeat-containing protein